MLGSNGQIDLGNNSYVSGGIQLGTASTPPPILGSGSTLGGPVTYRSEAEGAFVLAPVDMGNTATVNDNGRIASGQDSGSNVTYTNTANAPRSAVDRQQRLAHARRRHLQLLQGLARQQRLHHDRRRREDPLLPRLAGPADGGVGDCIPDNTRDREPAGGQARSNGYGGMALGQGSNFNNPGHAINFQIYMYGYTNGTHTVEFNNSSAMNAAIYAPTSELIWKNTAGITGGGRREQGRVQELGDVRVGRRQHGQFSLSELRTDTVSVYYRMAWTECRRIRTTTSDPESGC